MSDMLTSETLTPLICDLLEWLAREARTHAEVMDGWRTSCPRLPVWEEATDNGLVARRGAMLAFVEVKARASAAELDLAIDERRLARVAAAAEILWHDLAKPGDDAR